MVQGWRVKLRVRSKSGTSDCRCGPGLEDQREGVVQGWKISVEVWSRAGLGERTAGIQIPNIAIVFT